MAAKLDDRPVAGKTGTSEGGRDLWFIGSIPQLTTAVWFGYDNNRETNSSSGEAAWAWKQFMNTIKGNFPVQQFPPKPVLTRLFRDNRGTKRALPERNNDPTKKPDDPTKPDTSWDTSTPADPNATAPQRNVVPPGGPPVDEFFRPMPVQ